MLNHGFQTLTFCFSVSGTLVFDTCYYFSISGLYGRQFSYDSQVIKPKESILKRILSAFRAILASVNSSIFATELGRFRSVFREIPLGMCTSIKKVLKSFLEIQRKSLKR